MRLFDDNFRYTEDNIALSREINEALRPLYQKWVERGASIREIGHAIVLESTYLESHEALMHMANIHKKAKNAT